MHSPPDLFPNYLKEYTNVDSKIEDGPTMNMCVGVHDNPHSFLPVEGGSGKCVSCNCIICKTCSFMLDDTKKNYCAKCYALTRLLPHQSTNVPMPDSLNKSTGVMRKEILDAGFDLGVSYGSARCTRGETKA